ncbi:MAG: ABC transporter permease [Planctomyces sp.]|nr:ABC transporter permease [Planctomyces sp.]
MSNPIIHRELIRVLRDKRSLLLQCGLSLAFTLLIALRWPTEPRMALSGERAQQVFRLFSFGLLGAILLLLPVYPATSIVRERRQGTLALLLNTPLGPLRIYFGKLLAMLGLAGLMLAISIPAAAACYALGGITFRQEILGLYVVLALTAVQCTAIGLLVSTLAQTTDSAVRLTYGTILAVSVLALAPYQFFVGSEGLTLKFAEWLRCASPLAAMMERIGATDVGSHGLSAAGTVMGRFVLMSAAISVGCAAATISRLNHRLFDRPRAAGKVVEGPAILRRLMFLVDPQRRSRSIGPLTNPVMVKEFRCRRFGRLHWMLRLVAFCTVLSLALAILSTTKTIAWDVPTIGALLVLLQVALIVLITPSLASGLISAERETRGWVLLQMTPMSAWRIVWGKLLSVLLTVLLIMCATLPGYLVMVYLDPGQRFQVQRVVICLGLTALFAMLSSAALGSFFARTSHATAASYVLLLGVCALPLLFWLGRDAPFGHDTVEAALTINPIAAALNVIRLPGFRDYALLPAHWWLVGVASAVSLLLLLWQTRRLSQPR